MTSHLKRPPLFIVIEGPDGSGKSTQARLLAEALAKLGQDALLTVEPTHGLIGSLIRADVQNENPAFSSRTQMLLFAADRNHHLETELQVALEQGQHVVCDRYVLSSLAYQSLNFGHDDSDTPSMQEVWTYNQHFIMPDLTLYLDVPLDVRMERITKRKAPSDAFETQVFQAKIGAQYDKALDLVSGVGWMHARIDALGDEEAVHTAIIQALIERPWTRTFHDRSHSEVANG